VEPLCLPRHHQSQIHPATAKELEIEDADWVWIENVRGMRVRQRVHLTDGIRPRVVSAQHSWRFPEKGSPETDGKNLILAF